MLSVAAGEQDGVAHDLRLKAAQTLPPQQPIVGIDLASADRADLGWIVVVCRQAAGSDRISRCRCLEAPAATSAIPRPGGRAIPDGSGRDPHAAEVVGCGDKPLAKVVQPEAIEHDHPCRREDVPAAVSHFGEGHNRRLLVGASLAGGVHSKGFGVVSTDSTPGCTSMPGLR